MQTSLLGDLQWASFLRLEMKPSKPPTVFLVITKPPSLVQADDLRLGLYSLNLGLDPLHLLLLAHLARAILLALCLPVILALAPFLGLVVLLPRVLADGLVGLLVHLLEAVGLKVILNVLRELALVALLVVVGQRLHVLGHVAAKDVLTQRLRVQLLGLDVVAREPVLRVGHQDAAVRGALHGAEDACPRRGARQPDVQVGLEGSARLAVDVGGFGQRVLAAGFLDAGEVRVEVEFLQGAPGEEQAGGVGGGPIGEAVLDAVGTEFVRVGGAEDFAVVAG